MKETVEFWAVIAFWVGLGLLLFAWIISSFASDTKQHKIEQDNLFADCLKRNNDPMWCRKITK